MRALHLCFWLHHPYELLGEGKWDKGYFGGENEFQRVNKRDYQPLLAILERNSQRYINLHVSLIISGVWLEQAERWDSELIKRLKKLVKNDNIELVITPYYYSLAAFYNLDELTEQVQKTQDKFEQIFEQKSEVLALPELCYHNRLAKWAEKSGFKLMLAGDASQNLDWRTSNRLYEAKGGEMRVLFENHKLTEMVAKARKSVTIQVEEEIKMDTLDPDQLDVKPTSRKSISAADFVQGLTSSDSVKTETVIKKQVNYKTVFSAKKFQKQLDLAFLRGNLISLCFDPGIFGQWRELGIIGFFDELIKIWSETPGSRLVSARDILELTPSAEISVKKTISHRGEADQLYQLPKWWTVPEDNLTQQLYQLRDAILRVHDKDLYAEYQGLTDLNYAHGGEQYEEILHDIQRRMSNLTTESDTQDNAPKVSVAQSTKVKVKFKTKPKPEPEPQVADEPRPINNGKKVEYESNHKTPQEEFYEQFRAAAGIDSDEPVMNDDGVDDFEAAIQVWAQRMKWSERENQRDLGSLAEAEVVDDDLGFMAADIDEFVMDEIEEDASSAKKKRKNKKIVID